MSIRSGKMVSEEEEEEVARRSSGDSDHTSDSISPIASELVDAQGTLDEAVTARRRRRKNRGGKPDELRPRTPRSWSLPPRGFSSSSHYYYVDTPKVVKAWVGEKKQQQQQHRRGSGFGLEPIPEWDPTTHGVELSFWDQVVVALKGLWHDRETIIALAVHQVRFIWAQVEKNTWSRRLAYVFVLSSGLILVLLAWIAFLGIIEAIIFVAGSIVGVMLLVSLAFLPFTFFFLVSVAVLSGFSLASMVFYQVFSNRESLLGGRGLLKKETKPIDRVITPPDDF